MQVIVRTISAICNVGGWLSGGYRELFTRRCRAIRSAFGHFHPWTTKESNGGRSKDPLLERLEILVAYEGQSALRHALAQTDSTRFLDDSNKNPETKIM